MKVMCRHCKGAGSITKPHQSGDPQLETEITCEVCNGDAVADTTEDAVNALVDFVQDAIKMNQFDPGMRRRAERVLAAMTETP